MEPTELGYRPQLNDEQWALIAVLFVEPDPDPRGRRPRAAARHCLESILWILKSGSRWKDLPSCFPSYATCRRRFAAWSVDGIYEAAWRRLVLALDQRGDIEWEEGLPMARLSRQKRGRSRRPNQTRRANQANAARRGQRLAAGGRSRQSEGA
ncbi:transposase [Anatilimnocola sp. NA78]|uniref:transposase n=1 Tax=Anatilimnocola sp. NA78 TaxID=3415683 RepID=UPI003CE52409